MMMLMGENEEEELLKEKEEAKRLEQEKKQQEKLEKQRLVEEKQRQAAEAAEEARAAKKRKREEKEAAAMVANQSKRLKKSGEEQTEPPPDSTPSQPAPVVVPLVIPLKVPIETPSRPPSDAWASPLGTFQPSPLQSQPISRPAVVEPLQTKPDPQVALAKIFAKANKLDPHTKRLIEQIVTGEIDTHFSSHLQFVVNEETVESNGETVEEALVFEWKPQQNWWALQHRVKRPAAQPSHNPLFATPTPSAAQDLQRFLSPTPSAAQDLQQFLGGFPPSGTS